MTYYKYSGASRNNLEKLERFIRTKSLGTSRNVNNILNNNRRNAANKNATFSLIKMINNKVPNGLFTKKSARLQQFLNNYNN
jgi:hypothetical protein